MSFVPGSGQAPDPGVAGGVRSEPGGGVPRADAAPSGERLLTVEALRAGYRVAVTAAVSFTVGPGEVIGIRGPNGAGKSTILKAIAGTARIFGGRVVRAPGLRIAHQQQNPLPLEDIPISGRELLVLTGGDAKSLPAWIAPLIDRRLDRLSGGQLQFLQVWACLTAPADLVLLDEPTNNVDRAGAGYLAEAFAHVRDRRAIVVISHDADFLQRVSQRIVDVEPPA